MLASDRVSELTGTIKRLTLAAPAIRSLQQSLVSAGFTDDRAHTYTIAILTAVLAVPSQAELQQTLAGG